MEEKEIEQLLSGAQIFRSFCEQLCKDFEGSGSGDALPELSADPTQVRAQLLNAIVRLHNRSSNALPALLYRVDVSEKQLRDFMERYPSATFEETVCELVLQRVLQKVVIRKRHA